VCAAGAVDLDRGSAPTPGPVELLSPGDPDAPLRSIPPKRAENARWGPRLAGALRAPQKFADPARVSGRLTDYVALVKPRLNVLVVASSTAGYYLGSPASPAFARMALAVLGTALVAGGAAALNQVFERDTDSMMERTRHRPLPDGRVAAADAQRFGLLLAVSGIVLLGATANAIASLIAAATLVIYLAVYTPLKRRSPVSTLVGAVPGALPPLIGWSAASGAISPAGWSLFAIVFLWQIPHFMAIAWLYRDDYRRAGFRVLAVIEPDGRRSGRQALLYAAALLPVSLVPTVAGVAGSIYFWSAALLGVALLWLAARFWRTRSDAAARALFYGSITYLPLLWAVMILDH
jgi:protoheme IX farnesyltransferase